MQLSIGADESTLLRTAVALVALAIIVAAVVVSKRRSTAIESDLTTVPV